MKAKPEAKPEAKPARQRPPASTWRRAWLRLGPGLLLAAALSVLAWRRLPPGVLRAGNAPRSGSRPTPASSEGSSAGPLSAPEPAWLLARRGTLRLSSAQVKRLTQLRARWQRDTRQLRGDLALASAEFDRDVRGAAPAGGHRLTLQQLQERAAPVSELSRQLAGARSAWWQEAAQVLAASQRRRAEDAWARRFATPPQPRNP